MNNISISPLTTSTGLDCSIPSYSSLITYPNAVTFTWTFPEDKGMTVQIKTVETIDGTKAQIVLQVGVQNIIVWESEAFQDKKTDDSFTPAASIAQQAAEDHAKGVLRDVFGASRREPGSPWGDKLKNEPPF